MAQITLVRPDFQAPPVQATPLAERRPLPASPVIGLVDNGKPHARELLELLAEELRSRIGGGETILVRKPGASHMIGEDEARELAARAHLIVTGVGD